MTIDHTALLFLSPDDVLYWWMRFFGRLTAPIMSFMLAEGFRYTHSFKRYSTRMFLFAIIAQPLYFWMLYQRPPQNITEFLMHLNVLFTLGFSLIMLKILTNPKQKLPVRIIESTFCFALCDLCDWFYLIPAWVLASFLFSKVNSFQKILLLGISFALLIQRCLPMYENFSEFSYQCGVVLSLIPLSMYNGKRTRNQTAKKKSFMQWMFYVYYPFHITVLLLLKTILKNS